MKSKKIITALLGLALISPSFAAPVMAAENFNPSTQAIEITPRTAYNWTQTDIGVSANGTAWFKGPSGNDYFFDTSGVWGNNGTLNFSWSGASSDCEFYIKVTNQENGYSDITGTCSTTSGSRQIVIPHDKHGDYKVTIHNQKGEKLVIKSMTLDSR